MVKMDTVLEEIEVRACMVVSKLTSLKVGLRRRDTGMVRASNWAMLRVSASQVWPERQVASFS